ncbi:hypothetical protein BCY90_15555 [Agrobacterium deltaense]|nr:hypothetical protein L901_18390 [Agrobacterium sp. D14]RKF41739.1 hypothetical protein BCY90_15555 [Agrobacterium deltaense]
MALKYHEQENCHHKEHLFRGTTAGEVRVPDIGHIFIFDEHEHEFIFDDIRTEERVVSDLNVRCIPYELKRKPNTIIPLIGLFGLFAILIVLLEST